MTIIREDGEIINDAFNAVSDATEEAIKYSLTYAKTTRGRRNRIVKQIPYDLFRKQ